jgi:hypothetical protein
MRGQDSIGAALHLVVPFTFLRGDSLGLAWSVAPPGNDKP